MGPCVQPRRHARLLPNSPLIASMSGMFAAITSVAMPRPVCFFRPAWPSAAPASACARLSNQLPTSDVRRPTSDYRLPITVRQNQGRLRVLAAADAEDDAVFTRRDGGDHHARARSRELRRAGARRRRAAEPPPKPPPPPRPPRPPPACSASVIAPHRLHRPAHGVESGVARRRRRLRDHPRAVVDTHRHAVRRRLQVVVDVDARLAALPVVVERGRDRTQARRPAAPSGRSAPGARRPRAPPASAPAAPRCRRCRCRVRACRRCSSCSRGWMCEIVHRVGGDPVLHPLPRLAAVERRVDAEVRADEQQVGIAAVLADHVDRFVRQVAGDRRPGGAVVGRLPHERLEVVVR